MHVHELIGPAFRQRIISIIVLRIMDDRMLFQHQIHGLI